ncbi:MAG: hypothetical protein U0361_15410 [Nitrospiraceae bacterium]
MMGLPLLALILGMTMLGVIHSSRSAKAADSTTSTTEAGLQIEITKIRLGKEVVITRGNKEWFMPVESHPENSVVISTRRRTARAISWMRRQKPMTDQ